MFDTVRVEYRDMAAWYADFLRSYTNTTLKLPLIVSTESLLQAHQRRTTLFVLVVVGCGMGCFLRFLRCLVDRIKVKVGMTMDNIIHLIGAEPSKEMLEVARRKFVGRQKRRELKKPFFSQSHNTEVNPPDDDYCPLYRVHHELFRRLVQ